MINSNDKLRVTDDATYVFSKGCAAFDAPRVGSAGLYVAIN